MRKISLFKNIMLAILLFQTYKSENPFLVDSIDFFVIPTNSNIIATIGTVTQNFSPIGTLYSGNENVFYLQGGFSSLNISFDFNIVRFAIPAGAVNPTSQTYIIQFTQPNNSIVTLTVTYYVNGYNLTIANCNVNNIALSTVASTVNCTNTAGETINVTHSYIASKLSDGAAVIKNNPTTEIIEGIYTLRFNIVYTPSQATSTYFFTQLSPINLRLSTNMDRTSYISFTKFVYALSRCPAGCIVCSSTTSCTSCSSIYALSSGLCVCGNTLENQFLPSALIPVFYDKDVCTSYGTIDTSANAYMTCASSIHKLVASEKVTTNAFATFNLDQIDLEYVYTNADSINYLSATCRNDLIVRFGLYLPEKSDFQTLYYKLANDRPFTTNGRYILTIPNYSDCATSKFPEIDLESFKCTIVARFGYFNSVYLNSVANITQNLLILRNSKTQATIKKVIIPLFSLNTEYSVATTSGITAKICKDATCSTGVATGKFTRTQKVYITVNIQDPIYFTYSPEVSTTLTVNGDTRNGLIDSVTSNSNNMLAQFLVVISLDSSDLKNNLTMKLNFTYSTNGYSRVESVTFVIPMSETDSSTANKPFYKTLAFFVLVFTFGTIPVCAVFGLLAFAIAKLSGRHINQDEKDEFNHDTEGGSDGKFRNIEMAPAQNNRFNKLLDSLM